MPRKPKAKLVDLLAIPAELLQQFGNSPITAEAINARALVERTPGGEMNSHLCYAAKPPTEVGRNRWRPTRQAPVRSR